jgi:hypothetical protein
LFKNNQEKIVDLIRRSTNGREDLTWVNQKISISGFVDDAKVYGEMVYVIDPEYTWDPGEPTVSGGTLTFKGAVVNLIRKASDHAKPAEWRRSP